MLCASPKVDISSKPTNSKDNHTEKNTDTHTYTHKLPKATQTHRDGSLLSHIVLSVSKQVFLSITQTAPSCVCQCYVKLLNSGTTSLVFTEMCLCVSLHCQAESKGKRLQGGKKIVKLWDVFQDSGKMWSRMLKQIYLLWSPVWGRPRGSTAHMVAKLVLT